MEEVTLRQLQILEAIVRLGSAGAAARRLGLTQPAVSRALAALEERLGTQLFERQGRGMRPTSSGTRAVATAREVINSLGRLRHDLEQLRTDRRGLLRLATECYTCYHWLPSVLARFRTEFPGFEVEIAPEATRSPLAAIDSGDVDIAITHSAADPARFRQRPLFRDELLAILPPGHTAAAKERLEPTDFGEETLLLHSDPEGSQVVRAFLAPAGVEPKRILCLHLSEAVLEAVRAGLGITAMARWAVASELATGRLIARPLGEGLARDWSLTTRIDQADRPALAALARWVASEPRLRGDVNV